MRRRPTFSEITLVNGSTGDPCLHVDYPGKNDAILFDAGDNACLPFEKLRDLDAVCLTHFHIDHFVGFDRILRANLDSDKTLTVIGPPETIRKVHGRLKSYEIPHFPFQQVVLDVREVHAKRIRRALMECSKRFPEPTVEEESWRGPTVFEGKEVTVEACHVHHTVPCLAFAMLERPGHHLDVRKLDAGGLRPGPWVGAVAARLDEGTEKDATIEIQGGTFRVRDLAERYFRESPGARIAYVTDTQWTPQSRKTLLRLAQSADRLYCDCFYADEQEEQARRHRHMTASDAARFAKEANVKELVLIHFSKRYHGRYDALLRQARKTFRRATAEIDSGDSG